ncbi:MAG TPA: MEKHLA domain-containing protein, partial [Pirellulales bacterium]|nr:MEKHLA domain-containing protein [Pirellulales bacterium]
RTASQGFVDDYQGIRISSTGRRFRIEQAVVWNVLDVTGAKVGQAATFSRWRDL